MSTARVPSVRLQPDLAASASQGPSQPMPHGPAKAGHYLPMSSILPRGWRRQISRALGEWTSVRANGRLATLARSGAPIVAGPWLGEVGFELLYWIPFLAWFAERFEVPRDRLVVVSRGGTREWYAHVASRYYDVFDQIGVSDFRSRNDQRSAELGEQKQIAITDFDRDLLKPVLAAVGAGDAQVLHPSTMFHLFRTYWWGHANREWVRRHARFRPLLAPPRDELLGRLPRDYVAVKFYYNDAFPATESNRAFARDVMRSLKARGPIVSLSTGLALDDHQGWEEEEGLAAHGIKADLNPATNLALQTAIVANARSWVGTYGGFAYLAPFHRVPATAYYSVEGGFSTRHLTLAQDVFAGLSPEPLLSVLPVGSAASTSGAVSR
jgi:hypothetical protein